MKRREFLKKAALTGAISAGVPYILPSGRLFAATGARKANHVVFCLFAGGVRNIESVEKADGNLMPYTLNGSESISNDIEDGMSPIPNNTGNTLQNIGTLFKEFRYKEGPTGHFNGHTTAITGNYTNNDVQLRQPPKFPTVFELYRKHSSPDKGALNAWWITDSLGPYPYLNYSSFEGYGADYGANMIQPSSIFLTDAGLAIGDPKVFGNEEITNAASVRNFLNGQFQVDSQALNTGIVNSEEDKAKIESWLFKMRDEVGSGAHNNPFGIGNVANGDVYNMFYALKVLEEFEPELMVVNMQGIDVCHTNFTSYCNNIRKADYALAQLWQGIQNIPGMAGDTVLIAVPEHGRNEDPNTLRDAYGRYAIDHTSDEMSRRLFCLIAGPSGIVTQGQVFNNELGESIDVVPTIANILGFDNDVPGGFMPGQHLEEAFN